MTTNEVFSLRFDFGQFERESPWATCSQWVSPVSCDSLVVEKGPRFVVFRTRGAQDERLTLRFLMQLRQVVPF